MKILKEIIKKILIKNPVARRKSRELLHIKRRKMYDRIAQENKIQENLIAFSSFRGRAYSCNPKAIYEEVIKDERFDNFEFVWFFNDLEKYDGFFDDPRTKIVKYYSSDYYRVLAAARIWIFNMAVPPYVFPKEGQIYLQTWHGTPLKRIGCDLDYTNNAINNEEDIFKSYNREGEIISHLISQSPFATGKLQSAFNLPNLNREEIMLETGYPRNDILINYEEKVKVSIKEKLNLPSDKKVILYAPTWRDNQYSSSLGFTYDLEADFNKMKEHLSDEYIILFRAHYLVANSFNFDDYREFVFDVSNLDDINDLYIASDILVTDYSSVFFDYVNINKPVVFYMYDLDEYRDDIRGFYLDINELPGPIVQTEKDLVEAINKIINIDVERDSRYQAFKKRFTDLDDGKAAKRVLNRLWEDIND